VGREARNVVKDVAIAAATLVSTMVALNAAAIEYGIDTAVIEKLATVSLTIIALTPIMAALYALSRSIKRRK